MPSDSSPVKTTTMTDETAVPPSRNPTDVKNVVEHDVKYYYTTDSKDTTTTEEIAAKEGVGLLTGVEARDMNGVQQDGKTNQGSSIRLNGDDPTVKDYDDNDNPMLDDESTPASSAIGENPNTRISETPLNTTISETRRKINELQPPPKFQNLELIANVDDMKEILTVDCDMLQRYDLEVQTLQKKETGLKNDVYTYQANINKSEHQVATLEKLCKQMRVSTEQFEKDANTLIADVDSKEAQVSKVIKEQINPIGDEEEEKFLKETEELESLKEKLQIFVNEYENRENVLAERDRLRELEFQKFAANIERIKEDTIKEQKELEKLEKETKKLEKDNEATKKQITEIVDELMIGQEKISKSHKEFDTISESIKKNRVRKSQLEYEAAQLESSITKAKKALKDKKRLEKEIKNMRREMIEEK